MTTAAEQVTVIRAGLDPTSYEAGAKRIEEANARIAESGERVVITEEKTQRSRQNTASSYERLKGELDQVYRAQQQYAQGLERLARAAELGRGTDEEQARMQQLLVERYERVRDAAQRAADAQKAQEVDRLTSSLNGYVHALDPVAASLAKVTEAEKNLIALRRAGVSATPEQVAAVVRMREKHEELAASSGKVSNALGLQRYQVQNLSAQFVDFGVQVSSGGGVLLPLIQQAPQAIDAAGGVRKSLELLGAIFTPTRVAALAVAGGVTAIVVAALSAESRLNGLRNSLRAYADDYAGVAARIDQSSRQQALRTGESRSAVAATQVAIVQADPSLSQEEVERATDLARTLAKTLDSDLASAAQRVTRIMAEPAAAIRELAEKGVRGLTVELVRNIEQLDRQGRSAEAARLGLAALQTSLGTPEDSPMQKAVKGIKTEFGFLWDTISEGLAGSGTALLSWMERVMRSRREMVESLPDPSAAPFGRTEGGRARSVFEQLFGLNPAAPQQPTQAPAPSTTPSDLDARLAMIRPTEGGTRDPYNNTQGNNRFLPNGIGLPIETMTVDMVRELMGEMLRRGAVSSSVGAYQINRDTLNEFQPKLGISGDALFDRATQDRIAAAIIASVGNPNSDGYLERLRKRFEGLRSVPDGTVLSTFGAVRQAGSPAAPASTLPLPLPAPTGTQEDRDYTRRALDAGRGTLEEQRRKLSDEITGSQNLLREAQERGDQGTVDRVTEQLRDQRTALEALRDPVQQHLKGLADQAAASTRLEGAAGAVARELAGQARIAAESGRTLTDAARAAATADILKPLQDEHARLQVQITRTTLATRGEAEAWLQGGSAGQEYALRQRAINDARAAFLEDDPRFAQKVAENTELYRRQASAAAELATAQKTVDQSRQLQGLEAESRLIGANADVRERELAALKARQDLVQRDPNVDLDSDASRKYVANAQAITDQTRANTQLRNSWEEMSRVGEQAFDRIGDSITEAFANGGLKAVSFKNIAKAVFSEVIQAALRMAVINPLLNSMFGGTRATLGGVMTVLGGGGGGGASDLVGAVGTVGSLLGGGSGGASSGAGGLLGGLASLFGLGSGSAPAGASAGGGSSTVGALQGITSLVAGGNAVMIIPNGDGTTRGAPTGQAGGGSGGLMGYGQQALQAYSLYDKLSAVNPTNYINGTTSFATGWGAADSFLNTPLISGAADAGVNATGAVTNSAGYGSMAQNSIDAAGSASAAGVGSNGLTVGGAALGVAGIAGGAYGIYAGIQKGGVGGGFTAAGGAATAGLSAAAMAGVAIPVYGWIAAAVLTIIGALLPGQKPSDRTGTSTYNTMTGQFSEGGLSGDRLSQANRDQAQTIARSLSDVASKVGQVTGLGGPVQSIYRVGVGARDGLTVDMGTPNVHLGGQLDEDGIRAVTKAFTQQMLIAAAQQTKDPLLAKVINVGGVEDPEKTLQHVDWYKSTYQQMVAPNDLARSIKEMEDKFQAAIDQAKGFDLPTDALDKARERERGRINQIALADTFAYDTQNMQRMAADRGGLQGQAYLDAQERTRREQRIREAAEFDQKMSSLGLTGDIAEVRRKDMLAAQDAEERAGLRQDRRTLEDRETGARATFASAGLRLGSAYAARGDIRAGNAVESANFETSAAKSFSDLQRSLEDLGVSAADMATLLGTAGQAINVERENLARTQARRVEDQALQTRATLEQPGLRLAAALGARGNLGAANDNERISFETNAVQSLVTLRRSMEDLGFSADTIAQQIAVAASAIGVERDNLLRTQSRRGEDQDLQGRNIALQPTLRLYNAQAAGGDIGARNEGERVTFQTNAVQSLITLRRSMEDLGWSAETIATQIGIASDAIGVERDNMLRAQGRRIEDGAFATHSLLTGLDIRQMNAQGRTSEAQLLSFDLQAQQDRITLQRQLEDLGVSAAESAARLDQFGQIVATEKQNLIDQPKEARAGTAAGVVSSLADYARSLRVGDASPLNARSQYDTAAREFQAVAGAAQAGDWTSITKLQGYSDTLLSASRAVNGSGARYVEDFQNVQRALGSIGDLGADRLTASVMTMELRSQTDTLKTAIEDLQGQVKTLSDALTQKGGTPPRGVGVAA